MLIPERVYLLRSRTSSLSGLSLLPAANTRLSPLTFVARSKRIFRRSLFDERVRTPVGDSPLIRTRHWRPAQRATSGREMPRAETQICNEKKKKNGFQYLLLSDAVEPVTTISVVCFVEFPAVGETFNSRCGR